MPDTSVMFKAWYEHSFELRESYGYGFGLLSLEDQEKNGADSHRALRWIIWRAGTAWNTHGLVVGPEPVAMDWILQTILSPRETEAIGFDNFPEFSWVVKKTEELLFRISRVFSEMLRAGGDSRSSTPQYKYLVNREL